MPDDGFSALIHALALSTLLLETLDRLEPELLSDECIAELRDLVERIEVELEHRSAPSSSSRRPTNGLREGLGGRPL
jgi:hypothetical protein